VGLICAGIFGRGRLIVEKICDDMDISPWQIEKIDAKKGKIWVYLKGGEMRSMSLKDAKAYRLAGCKYCEDFTNELADIALGDMGTNVGYTTLIVRRDIGAGLVANAVDKGYLRLSREVNPSPIIKMAAKKKSIKWNDETISGLNTLIQRSTFLKGFVEEQ
ncbi:MAG: Coenzyme F420 hydrogenase/dehydrogenase, beta subunit C-terminal domain, partial [Candidatus Hydrothermarchaeales archaeon]